LAKQYLNSLSKIEKFPQSVNFCWPALKIKDSSNSSECTKILLWSYVTLSQPTQSFIITQTAHNDQ
jgi:hypothetical protein